MEINNEKILKASKSWIGTKFHYHGRIKKNEKNQGGVDCIGFILGVADEIGASYKEKPISSYDFLTYSHIPDTNSLKNTMDKYFLKISKEDYKIGDILLFQMNKELQHVAIVSDIGIIHAYAQARSVVEHNLNTDLKSKIIGYYRFVKR